MSEEDLINAIEYLVKKYAPNRDDLIETIKNNPRSAKGVLYDLSMAKDRSWNNEDDDLIANISFYFFMYMFVSFSYSENYLDLNI